MASIKMNRGEEYVLTLKQLKRKYPEGEASNVFNIVRMLESSYKQNLSTDEEFKTPSATGCEDVLPSWKELPVQGEICGPPAKAGKFYLLVFIHIDCSKKNTCKSW